MGGEPSEARRIPGAAAYQRAVNALPRAALALLERLGPRRSLALSLSLTGLALAGAATVVLHDMRSPVEQRWIAVQERPIDYLPGTIVDRGRALLNQPEGAGFARLNFLVQPAVSQRNRPPPATPPSSPRRWRFSSVCRPWPAPTRCARRWTS